MSSLNEITQPSGGMNREFGSQGSGPVTEEDTMEMEISDVKCEGCAERIEEAVRELSGVTSVHVDPDSQLANVTFHPHELHEDRIREAVEMVGYSPLL